MSTIKIKKKNACVQWETKQDENPMKLHVCSFFLSAVIAVTFKHSRSSRLMLPCPNTEWPVLSIRFGGWMIWEKENVGGKGEGIWKKNFTTQPANRAAALQNHNLWPNQCFPLHPAVKIRGQNSHRKIIKQTAKNATCHKWDVLGVASRSCKVTWSTWNV